MTNRIDRKSATSPRRGRARWLAGAALGAAAGLALLAAGCSGRHYPQPPQQTEYGVDFGKPFIDVDEWRDKPRRHRYIHGGFANSHLRFSIYLPPKELYKERFLLELEGGQGGLDKMMTQPNYAWAFNLAFDDMGAYLVETNEGHWPDEGLGLDNPFVMWQASVYGTRYAEQIAQQMYGTAPKHGYVNGCSGGGLRGAAHIEQAPDLFSGAVLQAWGGEIAPDWAAYGRTTSLLTPAQLKTVIDAAEPGGSGDVYAGLNPQQKEALQAMYRLGWPREAANQMKPGWFAEAFMMYNILDDDPTYLTDFWTKPGYLGHDDAASLKSLLIDQDMVVDHPISLRDLHAKGATRASPDVATYGSDEGDVLGSKPAAVLKFNGDPQRLFMAKVTIKSGPDAGKSMYLSTVHEGNLVMPFIPRAPYAFNTVKAGDVVHVDNRDRLAYLYYDRYGMQAVAKQLHLDSPQHALIYPEERWWEKPDGTPIYPQRIPAIGMHPDEPSGRVKGKVILFGGGADEPIWPTNVSLYDRQARMNLGASYDSQFRFWWLDQTPHCSGAMDGPRSTTLVPSIGITQQALLAVMRWVEQGVAPPPSSGYHFTDQTELVLDPTAAGRKGIQPVVSLSANGKQPRLEVAVGTPVTFTGLAEVPPGGGSIVKAQFDFDGQGTWPEPASGVSGASPKLAATATHTFDKPGTYIAAFRVGSMPPGAGPHDDPVYNLARLRIVVK